MAANLRNLSDFAYICSQKNNMNGIYILLTIFLYFGMLLLVARFTGKNSITMLSFVVTAVLPGMLFLSA